MFYLFILFFYTKSNTLIKEKSLFYIKFYSEKINFLYRKNKFLFIASFVICLVFIYLLIKINQLTTRINEIENDNTLSEKIDKLNNALAIQIGELKTKLDANELTAITKAEIDELKNALATQIGELKTNLDAELTAITKAEIDELKSNIAENKKKLVNNNAKVDQMQIDIKTFQTTINELKTKNESNKNESDKKIDEINENIYVLYKQLKAKAKKIFELEVKSNSVLKQMQNELMKEERKKISKLNPTKTEQEIEELAVKEIKEYHDIICLNEIENLTLQEKVDKIKLFYSNFPEMEKIFMHESEDSDEKTSISNAYTSIYNATPIDNDALSSTVINSADNASTASADNASTSYIRKFFNYSASLFRKK